MEMKGWYIFLTFLSAVGFFACEELPVQPDTNNMDGSWEVKWQYEDNVMLGEAHIQGDRIHIKAYGYPGSGILSGPEEADYTIRPNDNGIMLYNVQSGVELTLQIADRNASGIKFLLLDDIIVDFIRK